MMNCNGCSTFAESPPYNRVFINQGAKLLNNNLI